MRFVSMAGDTRGSSASIVGCAAPVYKLLGTQARRRCRAVGVPVLQLQCHCYRFFDAVGQPGPLWRCCGFYVCSGAPCTSMARHRAGFKVHEGQSLHLQVISVETQSARCPARLLSSAQWCRGQSARYVASQSGDEAHRSSTAASGHADRIRGNLLLRNGLIRSASCCTLSSLP